jgi:outer membrane protein
VAPIRVGVINIQQAIVSTKEGQKAGGELQAKFSPRRTALEKRQADIQGLQDQLKKGGATMAEAAKEKIMRDIDAGTRSLNHDADDLNADMEQENGKLMQDLGTKMMAILDQYSAQNGYAVILDVSNQQNPVFWADASTVVTADIVKLYDQAHPAAAVAKPAAPRPATPPAPKPATPPATKKQ